MANEKKRYKCRKTIKMDDGRTICFVKDKIYKRIHPRIWNCPNVDSNICLRDESKSEHFMDAAWLHKHFVEVKEVVNG